MLVSKFGLHKDKDNVWWLAQGTGMSNAIGMPLNHCEVNIAPGIGHCLHDINLNEQLDVDPTRFYDELFNFFLPVPRHERLLAFLPTDSGQIHDRMKLVSCLQLLFSPVRDMMAPAWLNGELIRWVRKRSNSNVTTLAVFGDLNNDHVRRLAELSLQLQTRILFVGETNPFDYSGIEVPTIQLPKDTEALQSMPGDDVRALGAEILRRFMREG